MSNNLEIATVDLYGDLTYVLKGEKGDTGLQGEQGIQGPKGDTGPKGDRGESGNIFAKGDGNVSGAWHCTIEDVTEYYEGLTILFVVNIASSSAGTTLQINNLPACRCYRNATTEVTGGIYPVGSIVPFTYILNEDNEGVWRVADYSASIPQATNAIFWNNVALLDSTSTYVNSYSPIGFLNNGNVCNLLKAVGTSSSKKGSTNGFDLSKGICLAQTFINPDNTITPVQAYENHAQADSRYLCNTSSFTINYKLFYKFTKSNDLYYLYHPETTVDNTWDGASWWISRDDFPTDAATLNNIESNGIYFYYLGTHYGGTGNRYINFKQHHKLYHVSNGQWVEEYI